MVRYNDLTDSSVNYAVDMKRRLINVDSLYRESSGVASGGGGNFGSTATDFLFRLSTTVRNVAQMKVVSVEIDGVTFAANYVLLQINDESSIESKLATSQELRAVATSQELRAVAKIQAPLTGTKTFLTDSTGLISERIAFRNPQDIAVLRVRLLNPDGTVVTPSTGKVSFTLELDEVVNSYLYELRRKHIGYDPANVSK